MKHIKLKVNKDSWITHNITIFSAYYKLTDLEQRLLASIIKFYLNLKDKIKDDNLVNKNFLDSTHRSSIREEFKLSPPALTKYLNQLKEKKVLVESESIYSINNKFIPTAKLVFEFIIEE